MQINEKITINLSETDVKSIIANWAVSNGYAYVKPNDVCIHVGNEWVGYDRDERQVPRFKECTITIKK